jgi:hypothetical protein
MFIRHTYFIFMNNMGQNNSVAGVKKEARERGSYKALLHFPASARTHLQFAAPRNCGSVELLNQFYATMESHFSNQEGIWTFNHMF